MLHRHLALTAASALLLAAGSFAQTSIGPFTGALSEGFETQPTGMFTMCISGGVFGGAATLCTPSGSGAHITGGWSFQCQISPHSGTRLYGSGGATSGGGTEYTFPGGPLARFGGYFGMNHSGGPDITVSFFSGATLVNSQVVPMVVNCQWNWLGWDLTGLNVDRIHIKTNHSSTGYIMMDDMEADPDCASVMIYCTAKTNSAGCVPAIATSGTPSASAGSGFTISTTNVLDNKFGLYFYSKTGPNNAPFQGGTLCAAAPLVRTPVQNSGGTAPCGGAFQIDFNAYVASGADPALVAGQQVWAQTWSRDPGFAPPNNTSLSNAVTFTLCP
jgi:hypothetical protein